MTIYRYLNKYGRGGNHAAWWIFKCMVDAGWTVPMSGSGTGGLYATSNVFDMAQQPKQNSLKDANNVGVGSEPWGHAYCWVVLEDPSGNRQIIWQRDSVDSDAGDDEWYVGYSPAGQFGSGQTPGVDWDQDTTPAAPDQYNLFGTPTGWATLFEVGGAANLIHVAADDTPSPSGEYGVFMAEMIPSRTVGSVFMIDDIRDVPTGHPHPLVFFTEGVSGSLSYSNIGGGGTPRYAKTLQDYGGGGEALINLSPLHMKWGGNVYIPNYAGRNSDNKERALKAIWGFNGTEGFMGTSRWMLWQPNERGYPCTAESKTLISLDDMLIDDLWDGATVPVVP